MKNNTKKIVVLDRLDSSEIEQAIFILRDENYISESDAVSEAERIVKSYLASSNAIYSSNEKKKKFKPQFFLAMLGYTLFTVMATMFLSSIIKFPL